MNETANSPENRWIEIVSYEVAKYKFDNTLYDLIPEFNEGIEYTYNDVVEGNVTTRTVYTYDVLPTLMRFGCRPSDQLGGPPCNVAHGDLSAANSLLEVIYYDATNINNYVDLFRGCENLYKINMQNVTLTEYASCMFEHCSSLTNLDLSNWDATNVVDIGYLFRNCSSLTTVNLTNWDTGKVVNMDCMFAACSSMTTIDISNWDFSSVISATDILVECTARKIICDNMSVANLTLLYTILPSADFNEFHTIHANNITPELETQFNSKYWYYYTDKTLAYYAYNNAIASSCYPGADNVDLAQCNIITVSDGALTRVRIDSETQRPTAIRFGTNCNPTYNSANAEQALLAVAYVKTEYLTNMYKMFDGCINLAQLDTYGWNISNVTSVESMFNGCTGLVELNLSSWDTSNVAYFGSMFLGCSNLTTLNLNGWDVRKGSWMDSMFQGCSNLVDLDVRDWKFDNINQTTHLQLMFLNCNNLTQLDLSSWKLNNAIDLSRMFDTCGSLTTIGDISNWNTSNVTDMNDMFKNCSSLTELNLSSWNTSNVIDMSYMFYNCTSLISLDVSNWNTSSVTNMSRMFSACDNLTKLHGIGNWDVSEVTMMDYIFYNCSKLDFNIDNWRPAKLTNIFNAFHACKAIINWDLSNWNCTNLENLQSAFTNCTNLVTLNLSGLNSKANIIKYLCHNCPKLTTLNLSNWDISNVSDTTNVFGICNSLIDVTINNSNTASVNKLISILPTRTIDNKGTLNIVGIDDISKVDILTTQSKYWKLLVKKSEVIDVKCGDTSFKNIHLNGRRIKRIHIGDLYL